MIQYFLKIILTLCLFKSLALADSMTAESKSVNGNGNEDCPTYMNQNQDLNAMSDEALEVWLKDHLPPNAPLEMPRQILSRKESRVINALSDSTINALELEMKDSELVYSDYFNTIVVQVGLSPFALGVSLKGEIEVYADLIYEKMKADLISDQKLASHLLFDLEDSTLVFHMVPKAQMTKVFEKNLLTLGGLGQFVTHKGHKALIHNIKRWLKHF